MATKKIALFIDADNISAKFGKHIIATLESRGEIFIRRIYGNWEKLSLHGWNDCIKNFSLRPVQQTDFVVGKNATDLSLTIDAMDVLHAGKAETFALVSNDSDFTPLAIRLREGGKTIIGMGNATAANAFRAACDEFIDLSACATVKTSAATTKKKSPATAKVSPATAKVTPVQISPATAKVTPVQISPADAKVVPVQTSEVNEVAVAPGTVIFSPPVPVEVTSAPENISSEPVKIVPVQLSLFDEEDTSPHVKDTSGKNISPPMPTSAKVVSISDRKLQSERDKKIQQLHNILHEIGANHGDENGFFLLTSAGQTIKSKRLGFGVQDFGFRTLQDFVNAFPKFYETQKHENIVLCRCVMNQTNRVNEREIVAPPADDKLSQIHSILHETAAEFKDLSDAGGLTALNRAGQNIHERQLTIKGLGYSSLSKFVSGFPNLYELHKTGTIFYYRCK